MRHAQGFDLRTTMRKLPSLRRRSLQTKFLLHNRPPSRVGQVRHHEKKMWLGFLLILQVAVMPTDRPIPSSLQMMESRVSFLWHISISMPTSPFVLDIVSSSVEFDS